MATKAPLSVLVLSLLIWMPVEMQEDSGYDSFIKKNVDFPKNEDAYCNKIMKEREEDLSYAFENTFIHVSEEYLMAICYSDGQPITGIHKTPYPLPHTTCVATSEEERIFSGTFEYDNILVWCENGLPVDFRGH